MGHAALHLPHRIRHYFFALFFAAVAVSVFVSHHMGDERTVAGNARIGASDVVRFSAYKLQCKQTAVFSKNTKKTRLIRINKKHLASI